MPTYSYECKKGHEYEAFLKLEDYEKKTKCPKCKSIGKKVIVVRQKEPTFTDKLFPYYDKALNRVFDSKSSRSSYLKQRGLEEGAGGSMNRKAERTLMGWRVGNFNPRDARHALRD